MMTIDFSNLNVQAKRLCFTEVISLDKRVPAGMFRELNSGLITLRVKNFEAESVEDLKLCFASNEFEVIEFRSCNFKSVTRLVHSFFGNTKLRKIIVNNNIVADDNEPDRTQRIVKEKALFPNADKIPDIFCNCHSIKHLNFEPLFGQEYTLSQSTDAIANTTELVTINLGGLTFKRSEPGDSGEFKAALSHLLLHNCCDKLQKYYIDTNDEFTNHELKEYFDEVLDVRRLMGGGS